ncbi:MAG TPA: DUF4293 domain-containing protein [Bacteroidales bacterium]|nr:DUF4293 domain-containing protein [Bacteroidales bacterium]
MIQRIQTVYLLLTTLAGILFLTGNILYFSDGSSVSFSGVSAGIEVEKNWLLSVLMAGIPLISFITIFLYRKRKLQMKLIGFLITLIVIVVLFLGFYSFRTINKSDTSLIFNYRILIPLLMLIFSFLALRGIRKDEEIVRSYDRLR